MRMIPVRIRYPLPLVRSAENAGGCGAPRGEFWGARMTTSAALGPNESLIDERESRARLITPALVLDLDAMERNIATMAVYAAEQGVAFRPHAKTHKSVQIARRQLDAGALGICCATLGEAEALAAGGNRGAARHLADCGARQDRPPHDAPPRQRVAHGDGR